jgi:anti-sigma-K factor RskA
MNCEEFEELSGAYALGALTPEEMRAARAHLATCDRHADVPELQAVAAGLAAAVPEMEPPPALKSRIMDVVRAEAGAPAIVDAAPARPGIMDRVRGWLARPAFGYGLAGALAVVVAALLVWNVSLQSDDGGGGQTVAELSGAASGRVILIEDEGLAVMEIEGLDALPTDQVYQVWAISGAEPTSLGAFGFTAGGNIRTVMSFDPSSVDTIAITIEPAPGSDLPTSDPIISGKL